MTVAIHCIDMNKTTIKVNFQQIDSASGGCYSLGMKSRKIDDIRKRFKNEWLLIAVDAVDPKTHQPAKGHLLAHGARRQDIHEISKKYDDLAYIVYSEDWPEDLAACFAMS